VCISAAYATVRPICEPVGDIVGVVGHAFEIECSHAKEVVTNRLAVEIVARVLDYKTNVVVPGEVGRKLDVPRSSRPNDGRSQTYLSAGIPTSETSTICDLCSSSSSVL
jgi:hypothetical protein